MARSVTEDPFHDFRFRLADATTTFLKIEAGFTAVTMPNVSIEEAPYREGTMRWTQKFPGVPTVGDITLTRGIFRRDSEFHEWVTSIVNGGKTYRAELVLYEFHISDPDFGPKGKGSRETMLYECWGKDAKPTSDKAADSSNVALETLTISCERIEPKITAN